MDVRGRSEPLPRSCTPGCTSKEGTMKSVLEALGVSGTNSGASAGSWLDTKGPELASINPADGATIAKVRQAGVEDYEAVIAGASAAFETWRMTPAPRRGEVVRLLGEELRKN